MNRKIAFIAGLLAPVALASFAAAETTVTVDNVHLCCASCVKAASKAVDSVPGTKAECDQKAGKITITAPHEEEAQKAVDALVAAGFRGKTTGATVKDDAVAPSGNVKSLSLTTHNCCKKCTTAITKAVESVPGAKANIEPKVDTFTVTGDFDAGKVVKALNDAGFSVKAAQK